MPTPPQSPPVADTRGVQSERKARNHDPINASEDLARFYLRLAHPPSFALDRLKRNERALWALGCSDDFRT